MQTGHQRTPTRQLEVKYSLGVVHANQPPNGGRLYGALSVCCSVRCSTSPTKEGSTIADSDISPCIGAHAYLVP